MKGAVNIRQSCKAAVLFVKLTAKANGFVYKLFVNKLNIVDIAVIVNNTLIKYEVFLILFTN